MKIRLVVLAMTLAALTPIYSQAQSMETDNPWMLRVRAVDLLWQNGQSNVVQADNVKATNQVIPEFDISYFFTKNISTELVLTYPQQVSITYGQGNASAGKINALPPSLLLQYHFTDLGAFIPYVGAGINYTIFGNRQNFGFVAQIGGDYMLDKNWGLNIDLKYATMSTNVTAASGGANLGKLTLNPFMPAVGVTYKFQ